MTPPCGFPTAVSANAVAFRHAAPGWTAATPAAGRSPYLALGITFSVPEHHKERRVSPPHHNLVLVITNAQDQAKGLLMRLEGQGHPQTNESSAAHLALVTLQQRLLRMRSTTTSCFPGRGGLGTRRAGQNPRAGRAATFLGCRETLTWWESGTERRTRSRR